MSSPQVQISNCSINTMDTGASIRIPRSRSYLQNQRSQNKNPMPMCIYTMWVIHTPTLTDSLNTFITALSTKVGHSSIHKNLKDRVISPWSKVTRPKFHAHAHLSLIVVHKHWPQWHQYVVTQKQAQESQGQGSQDQNSMPIHTYIQSIWV